MADLNLLNLDLSATDADSGTPSLTKCISVEASGMWSGSSTARASSPLRPFQRALPRKIGTAPLPLGTHPPPERRQVHTAKQPPKEERRTSPGRTQRRSVYMNILANESAADLEQAAYEEARRKRYVKAITEFLDRFNAEDMLRHYRAIDVVSLPLAATSSRPGRFHCRTSFSSLLYILISEQNIPRYRQPILECVCVMY